MSGCHSVEWSGARLIWRYTRFLWCWRRWRSSRARRVPGCHRNTGRLHLGDGCLRWLWHRKSCQFGRMRLRFGRDGFGRSIGWCRIGWIWCFDHLVSMNYGNHKYSLGCARTHWVLALTSFLFPHQGPRCRPSLCFFFFFFSILLLANACLLGDSSMFIYHTLQPSEREHKPLQDHWHLLNCH